MAIYNRENEYLHLLSEREHTVKELASKLYVSEPTVRRDVLVLKKKNLIDCKNGRVSLRSASPDLHIPLLARDMTEQKAKHQIAEIAATRIKDGYTIMLDASTTAYCLLPHLAKFQNLFVITNGAKTALALATMGIKTICTGGEMVPQSFAYRGHDAEHTLSAYNADVAFFSCRGISDDGIATDSSIDENSMRRIMLKNAKHTVLLCDSSKFGLTYLNTLCRTDEVDELITNDALPDSIPLKRR